MVQLIPADLDNPQKSTTIAISRRNKANFFLIVPPSRVRQRKQQLWGMRAEMWHGLGGTAHTCNHRSFKINLKPAPL